MAEFNGFNSNPTQISSTSPEGEKMFLDGVFAFLCNRPAEAFISFFPLVKKDAAATFNCALCLYTAGDYEQALEYVKSSEVLFHIPNNSGAKKSVPPSLLKYEAQGSGYLSPMCKDAPDTIPELAMMQILRVKADLLYALGQTEELKKVLPLFKDDYENIKRIKNEIQKETW